MKQFQQQFQQSLQRIQSKSNKPNSTSKQINDSKQKNVNFKSALSDWYSQQNQQSTDSVIIITVMRVMYEFLCSFVCLFTFLRRCICFNIRICEHERMRER
jgi:hypothetical protein